MPTIRPALKASVIGIFWAALLSIYFLRLPLPGFWSYAQDMVWAIVVFMAALGLGFATVHRYLDREFARVEAIVIAAGAGFGILALLMFVLGWIGAWRPWVVKPIVLVLSVSGLYFLRMSRPALRSHRLPEETPPGFRWPMVLIASGALVSVVLTLMPPNHYDTLVYHLALPSAYYKAGRWIPETELIYSAFPQNLEMLWLLGILLRGDITANLIGWTLSALAVAAVISFGRRFLDESVGLLAGGLLAVMPSFLLLSSGGYVDVGLAFFSFMSLYILCLWRERGTRGLLALAGAFAGLACGVKYTGVIPFALGAAFVLWERHRSGYREVLGCLVLYLGVGLAVFSPWLVKNLYYVGNPVFPFFYRFGIGAQNPWVTDAAAGYFRGLTEYESRSPKSLLLLPWDIAIGGIDFGDGMDVLGRFGWAPLIGLLPCLWLCRRLSTVTRILLVYALFFFIPWGLSRPVLRFLIPLAPVLALLAAEGWAQGIELQPPEIRWPARAVLGALFASGFLIYFHTASLLSAYAVPLGLDNRESFLRRRLNYYAAADYINRKLPADATVFVLGDQRGYYYNVPVRISPVFNENPLVKWANAADSPQALAERLRHERISHVVVNRSEMQRLASYRAFQFTERGAQNWAGLADHVAQRIYQDDHCEVLAL